MADFSRCSAGTLFYGRRSRIYNISKWWGDSLLHSPSEFVDSTKIRLICLYIPQESPPDCLTSRMDNKDGTSVSNPKQYSPLSCSRKSALDRTDCRKHFNSRQFWLDFMIDEDFGLAEVNFEICKHFARIPFHHWIQVTLGHRSEVIDDFFTSVSMIRHKYRQFYYKSGRTSRVRSFPEMRHMNPLTRAIFDYHEGPFLPIEQLEFILQPIRTVIMESQRKHVAQNLIILGLRFEAAFVRPAIVNWSTKLSTDFDFIEKLISESPQSLAKTITVKDISILTKVTMEQLQSGVDTEADVRWKELNTFVEETILSRPALSGSIIKLAKHLDLVCNYFAMTAVVAALLAVERNCPNTRSRVYEIPRLCLFLEERGHYEYCRARTIADQGLPWLVPLRPYDKSYNCIASTMDSITLANMLLQICCYAQFYEVYAEND